MRAESWLDFGAFSSFGGGFEESGLHCVVHVDRVAAHWSLNPIWVLQGGEAPVFRFFIFDSLKVIF